MKRRRLISTILHHTFAMLIAVTMIYPLAWMVMSSFKANNEIFTTATSLVPNTWDIIHNYTNGWAGIAGVGFHTFMINSLIVSSIATISGVFVSMIAAFAFARLKFKGK